MLSFILVVAYTDLEKNVFSLNFHRDFKLQNEATTHTSTQLFTRLPFHILITIQLTENSVVHGITVSYLTNKKRLTNSMIRPKIMCRLIEKIYRFIVYNEQSILYVR